MDGSEQERHTDQEGPKSKSGNRDMDSEDKRHGLSDIVVDAATERNCLNDRTEIIVQQDDGRRFARNIGAAIAHCDTNMCRL